MLRTDWIGPHVATTFLAIGIFISSSIFAADTVSAQMAQSTVSNATSARTGAATSSDISKGSPQLIGTEYDKTISLRPASINGTHGFLIVFVGNGILDGVNVTDNGKGFIANGPNGIIYSRGEGIWMGRNGNAGMAVYNFQGIGHYGADGKLRNIITDLQTNATGKLSFLGNVVVIDKNEIDKAGNAITEYWELK
jgi:hypothetical protein